MITREQIEAFERQNRTYANAKYVSELCRLALLGLAVTESGVTAEDIDAVSVRTKNAFIPGRHAHRVKEAHDALASALRAEESR